VLRSHRPAAAVQQSTLLWAYELRACIYCVVFAMLETLFLLAFDDLLDDLRE
jgi:hypothetical protein